MRIVSLSSDGHTYWRKGSFDFESLKTPAEYLGAAPRYFRSKLANVLWARQMAQLYPQLTVAAIHPGVVRTNLAEGSSGVPSIVCGLVRVFYGLLTSVEDGVKNQLWAAVSSDVKSGKYYVPAGIRVQASADGMDDELARQV